MNTWQQEEKTKAETLKNEFVKLGFNAEVIQSDDDSFVIIDGKYRVMKDYTGHINFFKYPFKKYNNIDSYKKNQIVEKFTANLNKMKVLSVKKVNERLRAIDGYILELEQLEHEYSLNIDNFIKSVQNEKNLIWHYDYDKIKKIGGKIERNGLTFSFSFDTNGYIKQNIEIHYSTDENLDTFKKLSDNKYQSK